MKNVFTLPGYTRHDRQFPPFEGDALLQRKLERELFINVIEFNLMQLGEKFAYEVHFDAGELNGKTVRVKIFGFTADEIQQHISQIEAEALAWFERYSRVAV